MDSSLSSQSNPSTSLLLKSQGRDSVSNVSAETKNRGFVWQSTLNIPRENSTEVAQFCRNPTNGRNELRLGSVTLDIQCGIPDRPEDKVQR